MIKFIIKNLKEIGKDKSKPPEVDLTLSLGELPRDVKESRFDEAVVRTYREFLSEEVSHRLLLEVYGEEGLDLARQDWLSTSSGIRPREPYHYLKDMFFQALVEKLTGEVENNNAD